MDINIHSAEDAREWAEFFADMGADVEMNFILQNADNNTINNTISSGGNSFINQEFITNNLLEPNDWVKKCNTWSWDDDIISMEQAKAAGYDDYHAPGSIIDNAKIGDGEPGSVYLGYDKTDFSYTPSNKEVTPWQVGTEWLIGAGPRHRDFKNGDYFTELLRLHDHIEETRTVIIENIIKGGELYGSSAYSLGGVQGVGKYVKDYSTLLTGGQTGNLAVTYLGSYNLKWEVISIQGGEATVQFSVYNSSTMQSASRLPVIGYHPAWQKTVGQKNNNSFKSGWGSQTSQSFIWTETLKLKK
ncbi:hypothetical protein ED312_22645 [Sinomicrobium pectinilyticum]|uniref:Uncharacterized protein n=1 Tax=Sinomicrobium pectinilyticum TaxID=1084421 RepID=A0A3N0D0M1_SINP1|nr:hypothetical protein [Sinomicrobium pectinilyticum]RNL69198.1 hypothetical protein ED312_22645 [Sinomicrobium pectinilyticum]